MTRTAAPSERARAPAIARLAALDRRMGRGLRAAVARRPRLAAGARGAAAGLAPAFQLVVGGLVALPPTRRLGLRALVAGGLASGVALAARDRIGRRRPGSRPDGGFPSRHAAAATAIAVTVGRRIPGAGEPVLVLTAAALASRVATADHDPADIAAGAALGWAVGRLVNAATRR